MHFEFRWPRIHLATRRVPQGPGCGLAVPAWRSPQWFLGRDVLDPDPLLPGPCTDALSDLGHRLLERADQALLLRRHRPHPTRADAGPTGLIINRYLVRELSKPLGIILCILLALFASYSASGFLSDAIDGLLPVGAIAELIGLKVLIALEVLIPASLYISVMLSFARLYSESEFAAMFALRLTPATMMRAVLTLSGYLALLVAVLSLIVRPWAYQRLHELSSRAGTLLDVNAMEGGSFYVARDGSRVIFLGHRDGPAAAARDVFVKLRHSDRTEIIHARRADRRAQTGPSGDPEIFMSDAYIYEIDRDRGQPDQAVHADGLTVFPDRRDSGPLPYSAVAASSARLAASGSAEDIAELQWRLSTPLSTLLLGMLGIPLSRTRPRQGRYARFGTALMLYFGYYLLCTSARTWVQHGMMPRFPGIWWAPGLLALLLLSTTYGPKLSLRRGRT